MTSSGDDCREPFQHLLLDQPKPWLQLPQVQALFLSRPVPLTCLQTLQWGFGSQTTPWMAIDSADHPWALLLSGC